MTPQATFQAAVQDTAAAAQPDFDLAQVRRDFPILAREVNGRPLVYLDNAASTQKPQAVLAAIAACYHESYANVGRGVHTLAQLATEARERARQRVADFLGAAAPEEIVFTRGTTEAINLVAWSFGRLRLRPGDEVLITAMEHHSNIVPWQLVCAEQGATLRVAPIDPRGELALDELERLLSARTRLVAVTHVSNVLGTVNPIARIAEMAHARGAVLVVDGAQSAPHLVLDVARLGCDFFAFSGHKVYGPSGIGVLYGRRQLLDEMPPWQGGGGMIERVRFAGTSYAPPPHRFEAGTPNIEGASGLAAALDYVAALGPAAIGGWERVLIERAEKRLLEVPGLRLVGAPRERVGVLSFTLAGIHPHDVATLLDTSGVAVRAGHHCAQPLMESLGLPATTRASFAFYNTLAEVETLAAGLDRAREVFA